MLAKVGPDLIKEFVGFYGYWHLELVKYLGQRAIASVYGDNSSLARISVLRECL